MNEKKKLIIFLFNKALNKYYRIYKRYFYILYIEGVSFSHFPKKNEKKFQYFFILWTKTFL